MINGFIITPLPTGLSFSWAADNPRTHFSKRFLSYDAAVRWAKVQDPDPDMFFFYYH